MRDDIPEGILTADHRVITTVSSWMGGELLDADIPLEQGTIDWTAGYNVAARADLSFPQDYAPRGFTDPIGTFGQRLNITQTIVAPSGEYAVNLGWYLIQSWDYAFPALAVEALSLGRLLLDYRLTQPYQATSGTTFAQSLRALARGVLPVDTSALTDRTLPSLEVVDEDRTEAINQLRTNWPADIRVDDDGVLVASPVRTVGTPVRSFRHGEADAYVSIGSGALRDEVYNAVVARGNTDDGTPVQAVAVDDDPRSPTYWDGSYGKRQRFYSSTFITSVAQAKSAAASILADELRRAAKIVVTAPPDPRLELGDTINVRTRDGLDVTGLLIEMSLPLVANQGPATYTVSVEEGI